MKTTLLLLAGISLGAASLLLARKRPIAVPVDELAHKLESAWANNHTVA